MSELDTSGIVYGSDQQGTAPIWVWSDLDAFTQGYIEAMPWESLGWRICCGSTWIETIKNRANAQRAVDGGIRRHGAPMSMRAHGFSDLAPETLARVIADCEAVKPQYPEGLSWQGRAFWERRQAGAIGYLPPLTVQLGDDGKVRFA